MKLLVYSVFLCCFGLVVPASADMPVVAPGTQFVATTPLTLHSNPPKWWNVRLPKEIGELKVNQPVKLLDRKSHNTLLGQQEWFLVEFEANSTKTSGWVLGTSDGQRLLTPKSSDS